MKKLLSFVLAFTMVVSLLTSTVWAAVTPTAGWLESFAGDTLTIKSAEDLAAFNAAGTDYAGKTVVLAADIVYDGAWTAKNFAGTFDGNGYSISGLKAPFINTLTGTVENLYLLDSNVTATSRAGILAVLGNGAVIDAVYINGTITSNANNAGGFLGGLSGNGATITNSWFDGSVFAEKTYVGGFVANQESKALVLENCLNTGDVTGPGHVGALSVSVYSGTLTATNCLNLGKITMGEGLGNVLATTLRDGSSAVLTNCFNDPTMGQDDVFNVRAGATLNGQPNPDPTTSEAWSQPDLIVAYDENTLAALGDAWAMGEEGFPVPAVFAVEEDDAPAVEGDIIITTWAELVAWATNGSDDAGKVVALAADIEAEGAFTSKPNFAGTFDGNDFAISGLNAALINKLTGTVKDLALVDSVVDAGSSGIRGILINDASGLISGVYVKGTITGSGNNLGGIAGHQFGALTIENSWFDGEVNSSNSYCGGFVGNQESNALVLTNCVNTATVTGAGHAGGLSVSVYAGSLIATNCVNFGLIVEGGALGSVLGKTTGSGSTAGTTVLTNCYTLEGTSANEFNLRSGATVNGMGKEQGTPSGAYVTFDGIPANFKMAELAATLEALGDAWGAYVDGDIIYVVPAKFANAAELPEIEGGGEEEDDGIIRIGTYEELLAWAQDFGKNEGETVLLTADIIVPEGAATATKGSFAGIFDGQGFSIVGWKGVALINSFSGTLKNIAFLNGSFASGIILNAGGGAVIENLYSNCDVSAANHAGGIVSYMNADGLTIENCWFDGTVTVTQRYAAGILGNQGSMKGVIIKNCLNTGTVTGGGNGTTNCCLAGISAAVYEGSVEVINCVNLGAITCTGDPAVGTYETAGLVGRTNSGTYTVTNSFVLKGTANFAEHGAGKVNVSDNTKLLESADDVNALYPLSGAWVMAKVDGASFPVPAVFADIFDETSEIPATPATPEVPEEKFVTISTWEDLVAWAADKDNTHKDAYLAADIIAPEGATWTAKETFPSDFYGEGFSIVLPAGTQGLFKDLSGCVSDLYIYADLTDTVGNCGILAHNVSGNANFSNVVVDGSIDSTMNNVGAFMGQLYRAGSALTVNFEDCINLATVICSPRYASGFVGNSQSNTTNFYNCLNAGDVLVKGEGGEPVVGGFAGAVYNGGAELVNCINLGKVVSGTGKSNAFLYRANKADLLSFTNCFALEGSADRLATELLVDPVEGQYEWMSSATDAEVLANFEGEWLMARADGGLIPIPAECAVFFEVVEDLPEIPAATTAPVAPTAPATTIPAPTTPAPTVPATSAPATTAPVPSVPASSAPAEPEVKADIEIGSWADLVAWATNGSDDAGKLVVLTADITAEGAWTPKNFAGIFDAQGYAIVGLDNSFISSLTGTVKDLLLLDSSVVTAARAGILAVWGNNAVVDTVYVNGSLTSTTNNAGGFFGGLSGNGATITNSWFDGTVVAGAIYASGFVANQESKSLVMDNCLNTGSVTAPSNAAGFSDAVYGGKLTITNSVNLGEVLWTNSGTIGRAFTGIIRAGGSAVLTNCYNDPTVADDDNYMLRGTATLNGKVNTASDGAGTNDAYTDADAVATYDKASIKALGDAWAMHEDGFAVPAAFVDVVRPEEEAPEEDDGVITTWDELMAWALDASTNKGETVLLGADITAPDGAIWAGKANFEGTFDGQGYSIVLPDGKVGLFTNLAGNVTNLFLYANVNTEAGTVGILTGNISADANITNVVVEGSISSPANNVGAFAGQVYKAGTAIVVNFENCINNAAVTCGARYGSGFVGNNQSNITNFVNCLNLADVTVNGTGGEPIVAAFAGAVYDGGSTMINCINLGKIVSATGKSNAFLYRANKADKLSFTNCFALEGSADRLATETLGDPVEGQYEWLSAADDAEALIDLADAWVFAVVEGEYVPVPAAFAEYFEEVVEIPELIAPPATSAPAEPTVPASTAPATSAPATSAPASSAPATSAPATSAPATSAPSQPEGKDGNISILTEKDTVKVDGTFDVYFQLNTLTDAVGSVDFRVILSENLELVNSEVLVTTEQFMMSMFNKEEMTFGCGMTAKGVTGEVALLKLTLKATAEGEATIAISFDNGGVGNLAGEAMMDYSANALTVTAVLHVCDFCVENTDEAYLKSAATCTDAAVYYYSCECGEKGEETFTYGEALGHSYTDFWDADCDVCGESRVRPTLGDANGDGAVSFGDIQRIYQHLNTDNKLTGDALIIADANKDGVITFGDIQRLYQHLNTDNKLF